MGLACLGETSPGAWGPGSTPPEGAVVVYISPLARFSSGGGRGIGGYRGGYR